jgi:antitoxin (DNA-binding transcriptional repressor) of toxin-antitoxin stability system
MHEAKTHLSRYIKQLKRGEIIVLCRRNQPVAEIRPLSADNGKRRVGLAQGEFVAPASFFEPLPDDLLDVFNGKHA